jgi:hypothetical protein
MPWQPTDAAAADGDVRRPNHTIDLFNGRDLQGWYPYLRAFGRSDTQGVFSVCDGMLRISGEVDGYLSTRTSWRDYRLVIEFRWGRFNRPSRRGKARDSGLFLHGAGPDGNSFDAQGAYKAAIECQIMEGAVGDLLLIKGKDRHGNVIEPRLTTRVAEVRDADGWPFFLGDGRQLELEGWGRINHLGKSRQWTDVFNFGRAAGTANRSQPWNRIECVCAGHRIRVFLNNQLVNAAENVFPCSGPILLQSEGSEIAFRKIELHPLPVDPDSDRDKSSSHEAEPSKAGGALFLSPTGRQPHDDNRGDKTKRA